MAEGVVLTAAGWVASPLLEAVIQKAAGYLGTNIEESKKKLALTVIPHLSLAIEKAEASPNKGKLEAWLNRLKDAYYEAEEVLDEFHYEELKRKVKDLKQKAKNKRGTPTSLLSKFPWNKLKHSGILSRQQAKLKARIDKLIEIAEESHAFRDLLENKPYDGNSGDPVSHRETHPEPLGRVFGREKDIENVVAFLTEKPSDSEPVPNTRPPIPFIAITGRSGSGKTALAKEVYNYIKNEKQNHFDFSVWVDFPRIFKATDVIKDMINIIQPKVKHSFGIHYPSVTLSALNEQIKEMTNSKKILLVLDNFWCDSEDFQNQWENFISCLGNWSPESRILLTSQFGNAATEASVNDLTKGKPYNLLDLEESKFLELFMHHAWPSDRSDLEREKFEEIGREIVVKLKGDPGAAKQVGRELKGKLDLQYWEKISKKDWLGDNMKARIWSYQQLPAHLQRCFSFCGLFPKGTKLHPLFLIQLWMAEGLIQPKDDEQRMEDAAENYLHELVSRFFLEEHIDEEDKGTLYQLHDLLHDLAGRVQGDDFIRIDWTNSSEVPSIIGENIRHVNLYLSVECVGMINEIKDVIFSMKKLCTLVLCVESPGVIPKEVLQEILKKSKKLRVLEILGYGNDLPKNIGDLKHLRHLFVSGSSPLKKLPDSICKLYHLQVLFLPSCESIPKNFSELISLRCFNDVEIMPHISNVGRLTSLQDLRKFVVGTKQGYELHQLENLNQLRERLCISGLENVTNIGEAAMAKMKGKKYLEVLELEWNSDKSGSSSDDFQLLDALQPHPNISALKISGYRGNKFPNWLVGHNSLRHLKSLTLEKCNEVEEIPSIHESLPNCRTLNLSNLKYLKELPVLPPNLIKLVISDIPQLGYFSENDLLMKDEIKQSVLEIVNQIADRFKSVDIVQLDKYVIISIMKIIFSVWNASGGELEGVSEDAFLEIKGEPWSDDDSRDQILNLWVRCTDHHFKTMFNKTEKSNLVLPCSLTSLEIRECSITCDALSTCMQLLDSLSELTLCEIHTITSLPTKKALCALNNLRSLTIDNCFLLNSLGGIVALTSLTELKISFCINLNVPYEPLPSSLETLDLFHSITKIDVGPLSRLKELAIAPGDEFALKGLNSLTQLRELKVWADSKINISSPTDKYSYQLQMFKIDDPLLLTQMLSDETISSLQSLSIDQVQRDSLDDEVFRSLISLNYLAFRHCNIKCLPPSLKDLTSLHLMHIENCPNLCELEDLHLPENFTGMILESCPILTEKFIKDGRYQVRLEEGNTIVKFPTKEE